MLRTETHTVHAPQVFWGPAGRSWIRALADSLGVATSRGEGVWEVGSATCMDASFNTCVCQPKFGYNGQLLLTCYYGNYFGNTILSKELHFFRLHFSFIEKKCNALFYDRYYLGPINHVSITQHCARKCNKWTHLTNSSNCNGLLLGVTRKQVLLESDTAHAVEPRLWFRPDSLPDIGGLWLRNL